MMTGRSLVDRLLPTIAICATLTAASTDKPSAAGCVADTTSRRADGHAKCPQNCQCKTDTLHGVGTSVDCSSQGLKTVPKHLPLDTTELNLRCNQISSISSDDFRNCHWMLVLDLSNNNLSKLEKDAFVSLGTLKDLALNGNRIRYELLSRNIFRQQKGMEKLSLQNNSMSNNYPQDEVLASLRNLHHLSIDGIPNTPFTRGFSFLDRLADLQIYGGLDVITNDTFAVFANSSVTELKIQTEILYDTDPMSFVHFSQLKTLDLSHSTGLGLSNVSRSWWGLQFTNISELKLSRVQPYTEHSKSIKPTFFNFLNLTNITALVMSDNDIVDIYPLVSTCLPKLLHLDMSYNRLTFAASLIFDLWHLRQLRYLDVSHQSKRHLYWPGEKSPCSALKSQASGISDSENTNSAVDVVGIGNKLYHSHHRYAQNKLNFFDDCSSPTLPQCPKSWEIKPKRYYPDNAAFCLPLSPTLEIAKLSESVNVELTDMRAVVLFSGSRLKRIEYEMNGIRMFRNYFIFTERAKDVVLDFSNNGLSCMSPDVFKYSAKLGCNVSSLLLAGNDLGAQMKADTAGITFKYWNVSVLDLSRNGINDLPPRIFSELRNIETLNLSDNSLRMIEFNFHHMQHIRMLDVSYNMIASVDEAVLFNFSVLTKQTNLSVNFFGNPIQCSCETLTFLHWIDNNRKNLVNVDQYACVFHGEVTHFSNLTSYILYDLNFQCSKPVAVIVSASMTALVMILVVVSVFCYRYKWEVKYVCLKVAQRVRKYQLMVNENYQYDALIVYSADDSQWVSEELIPHLGDEVNGQVLKIFDHDKEILPGQLELEGIQSGMQQSRKVILVISRNFTQDNVCKYEIELARAMSVDRGQNIFVPVMLEDVEMEPMSESLRWIVRKMAYIQWPVWEPEREEFWNVLRSSISTRHMHTLI